MTLSTQISGPGRGSSSIKRLLDNLEAHGTKTDSVSLTFDLQRFVPDVQKFPIGVLGMSPVQRH